MDNAPRISSLREMAISQVAGAQAGMAPGGAGSPIGFTRIADHALAMPTAPLTYITHDNTEPWFRHLHEQPALVGALGTYRLQDCSLHRHGILVHGDMLITDPSHLGGVMREEARTLSPDDLAATTPITMDRPTLVFLAPGYRIYGHWLVDFLPRARIARQALGGKFYDHIIPMPHNTPDWAIRLLAELCGVMEDQILRYDPATHHINFGEGSVPTYGHASYHFHPATAAYWPQIPADRRRRRLCVSRLNFEGQTDGMLKSYIDREAFEQMALERGYELIFPETLPIREQIDLFGEASHVVGEYGSALHSMLFAPEDAVVGAIRCPNDVQLRISALKKQKTVIAIPERDWLDEVGAQCYTTNNDTLVQFFSAMEDI